MGTGGIRKHEPVRPWGRYGWQTINGFSEREPSYGFSAPLLNGMYQTTHMLYGSFRSLESETYYAAIRHYNVSGALSIQMYEAEKGQDFRYLKQGARAYRGGCYGGHRNDRWGVWDLVSPPEHQRFTLNVDDDGNTHWLEKDLIDVVGHQVGDLMQSVVLDAASPLTYTSRGIKCRGEVLGEEAEGYFFQDFFHLGLGQDWMVTEFFNGVQGIWIVSVTEFEDDSWEITNFFLGLGGFASALVQTSDGERLAATDLDVAVWVDDDDYVTKADFILDDELTWTWTPRYPDGTPRMPLMNVPGSPKWNEGVLLKKGEDRPWRHSEAWMEIYPPTLAKMGVLQ
jgi:hypothetical protein